MAVGLVLADEQTELSSDRAPTTADLRAYLRTRDKDALVDLLLDRAAEDEFVGYREMYDSSQNVGEVIGSIRERVGLSDGH